MTWAQVAPVALYPVDPITGLIRDMFEGVLTPLVVQPWESDASEVRKCPPSKYCGVHSHLTGPAASIADQRAMGWGTPNRLKSSLGPACEATGLNRKKHKQVTELGISSQTSRKTGDRDDVRQDWQHHAALRHLGEVRDVVK